MITCFEAKYYFSFWRPFHAIRRADTDGNRATTPDPTWTSFLVVNHPEYPSGHSCLTGAVTQALETYFGTESVPLTISSTFAGAGPPRTYALLSDIRAAVADAGRSLRWSRAWLRTSSPAPGSSSMTLGDTS